MTQRVARVDAVDVSIRNKERQNARQNARRGQGCPKMPRMAGMLDRTFPVGKGPDCLDPAQPNLTDLKIKQLLQQIDSSRFRSCELREAVGLLSSYSDP